MKYKLCDWEDNGYHDSYFYGVYFDTEDNALHQASLGATAYGGGIGFSDEYQYPTRDIVEKSRVILENLYYDYLKANDIRAIDEPTPDVFQKGETVITLKKVRFQVKEQGNCPKCNGTGFWVNPRNELDKRTCFNCNGLGLLKGSKVKDDNGKLVWGNIPQGTKLTVLSGYKFYGTVYRNGYNRPHRQNTTIPCIYAGQIVNVACNKLKLDREYRSEEELKNRAIALSYGHDYGKFFGCRAWLSNNWASNVQEIVSRELASK